MKLLILGGSRYIGKRFLEQLLRCDWAKSITVFSRRPPKLHKVPHKKFFYVPGDRRNTGDLKALFSQRWDLVLDFICFDAVDATLIVAEKRNVKKYIMISSQAVYPKGICMQESLITPENSRVKVLKERLRQFPRQEYSVNKSLAEINIAEAEDLNSSIVRLPIVISNEDARVNAMAKSFLHDDVVYSQNIDAELSLISVDDAVGFILCLALSDSVGVYNACAEGVISLSAVRDMFQEKYGAVATVGQMHIEGFRHEYDVHTAWESTPELSFMSISSSWSMSNQKASSLGYRFTDINSVFLNAIEGHSLNPTSL